MRHAAAEVRDSAALKACLGAVLRVGNWLNEGTARGDAAAFSLEVLPQLSALKASAQSALSAQSVQSVQPAQADGDGDGGARAAGEGAPPAPPPPPTLLHFVAQALSEAGTRALARAPPPCALATRHGPRPCLLYTSPSPRD